MSTLALSMIVKDAEATLDRCLESVRGVADEIVIADTGSSDHSREIARRHGARIFSIPWENDFAKARNLSLAEVTSDWVLVMDADEVLDPDAGGAMAAHLNEKLTMGYTVNIRNYLPDVNHYLWDQHAQPNTDSRPFLKDLAAYVQHVNLRLFRRHPEVRFQGCVHESVGYRLIELGMRVDEAKFLIHHFGFLDGDEARAKKSLFYRELGRGKLRELPDNALAHFELGIEESEHFHNYQEALELFHRATQLNPRFGPAWLFYGKTLGHLGKHRQALEAFERATHTSVRMETVLEAQADTYYKLGEFEETRRCYQQAMEQGGTKPVIESKLGFTEVRLGRATEGLDRLRHAISLDPQSSDLHDRLISALAWLGDTEAAAVAAERRLSMVSPWPEFYLRAASLRAQLQEWPRVLLLLRLGLGHFPKDEKLQEGMVEAVRRVLVADTEMRGDAQFQANDFDSARINYQRAIERVGYIPSLESKLGLAEARCGRTEEGLEHLRHAVEGAPRFPDIHDRLIAACVWLGLTAEGAEAAEIKLNRVEPQPEFYLRAASLRAQLHDWLRVSALIRLGLDQFPKDEKLHQAAAEIEAAARRAPSRP